MGRAAISQLQRVPEPLAVASISPATVGEWATAHERDREATFFHGPQWSEIWRAYSGNVYRPAPKRVTFTDGTTAILCVSEQTTRLGVERWHLSPAGTYGGWLWEKPGSTQHASALARVIADQPSAIWRLGPSDAGIVNDALIDANIGVSHVIDLRSGCAQARGQWRKSSRRWVRRAIREGARIRMATRHEDWMAFYAVYEESLARWSRPSSKYERSLFALLAESAGRDIRLWLVEIDGDPVGGSVVFTHGSHAIGWHAAFAKGVPGASNLLQWELVEILAGEGREIYDLSPSGGHSGVVDHKDSLGTSRAPTVLVHNETALERSVARVRRLRDRSRGKA